MDKKLMEAIRKLSTSLPSKTHQWKPPTDKAAAAAKRAKRLQGRFQSSGLPRSKKECGQLGRLALAHGGSAKASSGHKVTLPRLIPESEATNKAPNK